METTFSKSRPTGTSLNNRSVANAFSPCDGPIGFSLICRRAERFYLISFGNPYFALSVLRTAVVADRVAVFEEEVVEEEERL
jgi:hypothetical protein